jgi:hypothetical protein
LVTGATALDQTHRGEDAAVEGTAHRRPLLVDGATPLTEMNAGSIRAPLEHQLTIRAPLRQQVGQVLPIALLVHDDARVVAAGSACAARNRPRISAPPGRQEVPRSAAHGALRLVHRFQSPPILSVETVRDFEIGRTDPRASTLGKMEAAFRAAGLVLFDAGREGVRASARRDDRDAAEAPQLRGRRAVPVTTMSTRRLPQREQTSRALQSSTVIAAP